MTRRILDPVEEFIENRMGLRINREKTSVRKILDEILDGEERLDFLGYTFRYEDDLKGRQRKYLNLFPSKKSVQRARNRIKTLTSSSRCFIPIPEMIQEVSTFLGSWSRYFAKGYPRREFRDLNHYTRCRLITHLRRRSQRGYHPPKDTTYYKHLQQLGLVAI